MCRAGFGTEISSKAQLTGAPCLCCRPDMVLRPLQGVQTAYFCISGVLRAKNEADNWFIIVAYCEWQQPRSERNDNLSKS